MVQDIPKSELVGVFIYKQTQKKLLQDGTRDKGRGTRGKVRRPRVNSRLIISGLISPDLEKVRTERKNERRANSMSCAENLGLTHKGKKNIYFKPSIEIHAPHC